MRFPFAFWSRQLCCTVMRKGYARPPTNQRVCYGTCAGGDPRLSAPGPHGIKRPQLSVGRAYRWRTKPTAKASGRLRPERVLETLADVGVEHGGIPVREDGRARMLGPAVS